MRSTVSEEFYAAELWGSAAGRLPADARPGCSKMNVAEPRSTRSPPRPACTRAASGGFFTTLAGTSPDCAVGEGRL